jgi:LacI family transcriptional regulator
MPFVLVARYVPGVNANYVGADNERGASLAVEHLIARGHRRIAFVGGSDDASARQDRLKGYRHALENHGIGADPALVVTSPVSREGGYAAIASLLRRPAPSAVVCYNDVVAFGVMLGLQARGRTPGDDVAVVGFDDIEEAVLWQPALTTVAVGPRRIGEAAARLLLSGIEDPERPVEQVIVPPRLVVRESSELR